MNKIAITGHSGFIGKNLVDRFNILGFNIFYINRDLSNIDELTEFRPTYILHFGAEIYDDTKMIDANIIATYKLLEATKHIDYKMFINCGSSSEYGRKDKAMSEHDILEPQTMYEATKGSATLLCRSFAFIHHKPIITIRPFSVYGRYEKSHRFIPTLFNKFDTHGTIDIYPGVHDFIHIDDFVDGVMSICFSENIEPGEVINLGSGIQYTNLEVYENLSIIYKYELNIKLHANLIRNFDSNNWIADITKATQKFNFQPKYNLFTGLKQCYEERTNTNN
jgi:nucleoside-diphosphate-sugar epimerase